MSNCKNPDLRATSSCHHCNYYKQAINDLVSKYLACQPQILKEARFLLRQRRAHHKVILRIDSELAQLTNLYSLPRFVRFVQLDDLSNNSEK
mgnify:CR=1 FL=1